MAFRRSGGQHGASMPHGSKGPAVQPAPAWAVDVAQLLEEHHVVAWSRSPGDRARFATGLTSFLRTAPEAEVLVINGQAVRNLDTFCAELERLIAGPRVERVIDGRRGVLSRLRDRNPEIHPTRHRTWIWKDAEALLRRDHGLFGQLVDAMTGVAAEGEYASEDLLLLQRVVFVGAPALDLYAEDERGQFRTWATEAEGEESPLWRVVTGLKRPPVTRYEIPALDR